MPWAAAAAVVGAVVSADAQRSAGNKAADAQRDAAESANETQKYMYDQTRQDNLPALQARNSGLSQLQQLLGIGGDPKTAGYGSLMGRYTGQDLQNDPGYQFGLTQGTRSVEQSAAARGGLYSGATMKALQRYGQDYAGTKFNEGFNRNQAQNDAIFGRFASLAGLGQAGSSQLANAGQNYANNVGNNMIGVGNVIAANQINQGNQLSNGVNQLSAWAMNQNWGSNQNQSNTGYKADGTGMWWDGQ
jgi:hypothetical protein